MASIKDVAKEAGVSVSTVSAVVTGQDCVKHATRERVLAAIETLGYTPNIAARELVTQKKQNIGLILTTYETYTSRRHTPDGGEDMMYAEYINSISCEILSSGYGLLTECFCYSPEREDIPKIIEQKRVAGVIVAGSLYPDKFISQLKQRLDAVVTIGCYSNYADYVINDYKESIMSAVCLLAGMGHRSIAYLSGDPITLAYPSKLQGYRAGLEAFGIAFDERKVFPCRYTMTESYEAAQMILKLPPEKHPTAIVFASDILAAGAYRCFYEHGLRIPEDYSLIGFENLCISMYVFPRLASIDWNKRTMAEKACQMLLDRLKHPRVENKGVVVPCKLINRESIRNLKS